MLQAREKIIKASMNLFLRKGYKGTTTKTIAQESGVNELTIFRHFGTKEGILRAIVDERYAYLNRTVESISRQLTYDIAKDFPMLSKLYHEKLSEVFGLVLLFINDGELEEETITSFIRIPMACKVFLIGYFDEVKKRGYKKEFDSEIATLMYMSMNFGFLVLKQKLFSDFSDVFTTRYLDISVETFINSLE